MKRASDDAGGVEEVEQATTESGPVQTATKAKDAPYNKANEKRQSKVLGQPQHGKGSTAARPSTKRGLDDSEEDDTANLRRSKRARSSATPPTAMSTKDPAGSDDSEQIKAPSLRRSTRAQTSTTPPTTLSTRGRADGNESEETEAPSLHRWTRARTSTTPPTTTDHVHQRVKITVKDQGNSTSGSDASGSRSGNDESPTAPAKSKKESSGPSREYNATQLKWMNDWYRETIAGNKTHEKGLKWHLAINRNFEKEFKLTTPLKKNSLRNKRQEMKSCLHFDGPAKTVEFYEKAENYPRKNQLKSQQSVAQASVTSSAATNANASTNAPAGQSVQATVESSKKRKHDNATTVDGLGEVGENEKGAAESSQSPKRRRSGSGEAVVDASVDNANGGLSAEDDSQKDEEKSSIGRRLASKRRNDLKNSSPMPPPAQGDREAVSPEAGQ